MLVYLSSHSKLPVPAVRHHSKNLLIMDFVAGDSTFSGTAEHHAADLLHALHSTQGPHFGLERDTLIGGLHQPNPATAKWADFFRDHRLLNMGEAAVREGSLPTPVFAQVEAFAAKVEDFLPEPAHPALLHGDVWTTNVLAKSGRIAAFIDPAVYYGHPEIELAFITLFSTFGRHFFQRYEELSPLEPGFHEERRHLYNLYPLLVHVRLFGGGYVGSVSDTLDRFGFPANGR
jgi:fructosamine-3-kinase